jgi:hypothetical protein
VRAGASDGPLALRVMAALSEPAAAATERAALAALAAFCAAARARLPGAAHDEEDRLAGRGAARVTG